MTTDVKLIFFCGKMAAGKSTLAKHLGQQRQALLLVQDELLEALFPGEIINVEDFVKCSSRLRQAIEPIITGVLCSGISVVLDFPGNTSEDRVWFRELFERANVDHELHFIDAPDELCKRQLKDRSKHLPMGSPWTTEADFNSINVYFQPPSPDERFNVVRHERA